MCGFAGFLEAGEARLPPQQRAGILRAMGRQLSRRGPDDEQLYDDGDLAFVFRRLAIIDRTNGRQPIWNEDRSLLAAVNGEIYNHRELRASLEPRHRFSTRSDTEVFLHLYEEEGPAALDRLNGMFAVALWDKGRRRLFLARDRLGIKPLFYTETAHGLLFGSELKALLVHPACPRDFDWSALRTGQVPSSPSAPLATCVVGIEQLAGGHYAVHQDGVLRRHRYWSVEHSFPDSEEGGAAPETYVERYAALLSDSVERQLMSEVPVGVFLSGGLDSSLVAALAARAGGEVHCFHALERTTYLSGDYDAARRLTSSLGLDFRAALFDPDTLADELEFGLPAFESLVWLLESPRFHLEWLFKHELHRFARTRVPGLAVVLLGQGADEFAGGYSLPYADPHGWGPEGGSWATYLDTLTTEDVSDRRAVVDRALAPLLAGVRADQAFGPAALYRSEMVRRTRVLQMYNLWHEDRAAAGQGVEARVPFLDHRLVELLASIPGRHHAALFWDKRILRRVAERFLPADLASRPKVPFLFGRDSSSVDDIARALLRRVFPAFRSRYLEGSSPLFSSGHLASLFGRIDTGGRSANDAVALLLQCMAITVFEDLLRTHPEGRDRITLDPPSPLSVAEDAPRERWGTVDLDDLPAWDEDQRVALEAAVEVHLSLACDGAGPEVVFLRDGEIDEEMEIADDMAWVLELLRLLARRDEPRPVGELAGLLRVPSQELRGALRFLHAHQWVVELPERPS